MVAIETVFWVLGIGLLSWVKSHSVFDKTGNEKHIDYDSIILGVIGLLIGLYFVTLFFRG